MHVQIFWDRGAPSGLELPVSRKISQVMDLPVQVDISPLLFNGFVQSRNQFDAHQIIRTNEPNSMFDFNGNGVVDFADITTLMKEIR